jgi:hypothetical protein
VLCPGLACSWKHSCTVQMPAARGKRAHTARWHAWISSAHGTHMLFRPASADHAAGSVPVSWLLYSTLHSGGVHRKCLA